MKLSEKDIRALIAAVKLIGIRGGMLAEGCSDDIVVHLASSLGESRDRSASNTGSGGRRTEMPSDKFMPVALVEQIKATSEFRERTTKCVDCANYRLAFDGHDGDIPVCAKYEDVGLGVFRIDLESTCKSWKCRSVIQPR